MIEIQSLMDGNVGGCTKITFRTNLRKMTHNGIFVTLEIMPLTLRIVFYLSMPLLVQNLSMSLSMRAVVLSTSLMALVISLNGSHLPGGPKKPLAELPVLRNPPRRDVIPGYLLS